jgi:hypothetical protein
MTSDNLLLENKFRSCIEIKIGDHTILKGDIIELMDRGDGLWDVLVNGERIFFAIDEIRVKQLKGE